MKKYILFFIIVHLTINSFSQTGLKIGLLKYNGGGDWYVNPTSLPNLVKFCNENLSTSLSKEIQNVDVGSPEIFNYPFLHMTGHGNVVFTNQDLKNLRTYLLGGGFLHIDDNYGMDEFIRRELKKIFPENEIKELPFSHPIFYQKFDFTNGLPKIHEHNGKAPQAFGIEIEGRLVCLYTYECDLGDGWEDFDVHNDSQEIRTKALKMGANIIQFVFTSN